MEQDYASNSLFRDISPKKFIFDWTIIKVNSKLKLEPN